MKSKKSYKTFEEELLQLQEKGSQESLSIGEILEILSEKGHPLILIFLSLPFCQPIQIPGFSTPFGLSIAFIGLKMAFGKFVWLPKFILKKEISPSHLKLITGKTLSLMKKMKRWIYPRMSWICNNPVMEVVNSLTICVLGILLALPLPIPFSNLMAAWSIFFIAVGLLEEDGLFVIIGYVITLLTFIFFLLTIVLITKMF